MIETKITNEIKKQIVIDLKPESNIINKYNKTNKTTKKLCSCKIEKNKDCFYRTGELCKFCCSQKITRDICKANLYRSSLNSHEKSKHNLNQSKDF